MAQKTTHGKASPLRLNPSDMVRIDEFKPWWIRCSKCSQLAYMMPMEPETKGECKCPSCGGVYKISFDREFDWKFPSLPLWLKADFRGNIFWALNAEHLELLERVIRSQLRERPIYKGKRLSLTTRMPFNLPSWILSAKNRSDLLKLIARLRSTIPEELATRLDQAPD
jgi:hypothetical protein